MSAGSEDSSFLRRLDLIFLKTKTKYLPVEIKSASLVLRVIGIRKEIRFPAVLDYKIKREKYKIGPPALRNARNNKNKECTEITETAAYCARSPDIPTLIVMVLMTPLGS